MQSRSGLEISLSIELGLTLYLLTIFTTNADVSASITMASPTGSVRLLYTVSASLELLTKSNLPQL